MKLVIDKDIHDVIKPQWLYDCIKEEDQVPLRQKWAVTSVFIHFSLTKIRYFFHATTKRRLDKEYALPYDEDNRDVSLLENATSSSTADPERRSIEDERSNIPLEIQEWFGQTDEAAGQDASDEADSETDLDSNYDEARAEDYDVILDEIRSGVFSADAQDSVSLLATGILTVNSPRDWLFTFVDRKWRTRG